MFTSLPVIPRDLWEQCFTITDSRPSDEYWHLHLTLNENPPLDRLRAELRNYFELAHSDARQKFNQIYGISLDPLNTSQNNVVYPRDLPEDTKKGLFGEVLCGIVTRSFQIVGDRNWRIPAFLFRNHDSAGNFLSRVGNGEPPPDSIPGRFGNDFLAVCFDSEYNLTSSLVSEAKCRATFNITKSNEDLKKMSNEATYPTSLGQFKDILRENTPDNYQVMIDAIDRIIFNNQVVENDRIDMYLYTFQAPGVVNYNPPTRISQTQKSQHYSCERPLQAVEIHFPGVMTFINQLYNELYT